MTLSTEGRPASYAVHAGPKIPEKSELRHETILQFKNAAGLSNTQVGNILPFLRQDVDVQPNAQSFLVAANHVLDEYHAISYALLDIAVVEEKEIGEVVKGKDNKLGRQIVRI